MVKSEKLGRIIFLAYAHGFNFGLGYKPNFISFDMKESTGVRVFEENGDQKFYSVSDLLFNLDFAKAVFGEKRYEKHTIEVGQTSRVNPRVKVKPHTRLVRRKVAEGWQFHLRELALLDDSLRIHYVFENMQER